MNNNHELDGARVLVVEDHGPLLRNMAFLLQVAGFEVVTAANGQDALTTFSAQPVDVVVCDAHLPDMTGYEVMQTLAADGAQVPVVLTSGRYTYSDLMRALELGAADFVPKPFDMYDLLDAVCGALAKVQPADPLPLKRAS